MTRVRAALLFVALMSLAATGGRATTAPDPDTALAVPPAAAPAPDTALAAPPAAAPDTVAGTPSLAVLLDCSSCDMQFVRDNLRFASFVRDPSGADVQILVTNQSTGGGGSEYAVSFFGRRAFSALTDTVRFVAVRTDTEDAVRRRLVQTLMLGLARYVARTPLAAGMRFSYLGTETPLAPAHDPWRHWVFTVTTNGFLSGEQSSTLLSVTTTAGIEHVTAGWKISTALSGSYAENRFDLTDSSVVTSYTRQGSARLLFVRAIDDHWSSGLSSSWAHSTYDNTESAVTLAPALEYDVFPYSESANRQLRLLYRAGPRWFQYDEETIYGMMRETRSAEELSATLDLKQRWGSARLKLNGSHYFYDMKKNRLDLSSDVWLRVARGLSFTTSARLSRVRDQLSLPRRDATDEEILLQLRQLASGYSYSASLGLAFSFGSIYSGVVNPRFGN